MTTINEAVTLMLLDNNVRLDGDALADAERSVLARLVFGPDGTLLTPLLTMVAGEKAARPDLFQSKKR